MQKLGDYLEWEQKMQVTRDILLLFHDLAEYPWIDGDQSFSLDYKLPYWEFLRLDLPGEDGAFIHQGCLIMILAMAWDLIDGSGTYLCAYLPECLEGVAAFHSDDPDMRRLVSIVALALDTAIARAPGAPRVAPGEELEEGSVWANATFICGYFRRMADHLEAAHRRLRG